MTTTRSFISLIHHQEALECKICNRLQLRELIGCQHLHDVLLLQHTLIATIMFSQLQIVEFLEVTVIVG